MESVFNLKDCFCRAGYKFFVSYLLVVAIVTQLVHLYNFLCVQAEIYAIKKCENSVHIERLLSTSHTGKCVVDLVSLIHPVRNAAA